ncbi:Uncharacterised protein [Vibrio cholerae]|nr:Uncharacterised protein [Vibrio cholerae]
MDRSTSCSVHLHRLGYRFDLAGSHGFSLRIDEYHPMLPTEYQYRCSF